VILIIVGSGLDYTDCHNSEPRHWPAGVSILAGLGTMVFAFGGHSSFPNIQHDMKKPFKFTEASYLAFGLILVVYLPMGIISNIVYGEYIEDSIINSIQKVWIQQAINLMIMLHCLTAFTLIINPLNQQVEELIHAPQRFGWKRVVIRTCVLIFVLFMALTIPKFGPLLDLVGASATLLTVLVYPILFYFYLNAAGKVRNKKLGLSGKDKQSALERSVGEYRIPSFKEVLKYNSKIMLVSGFVIMAIGVLICVCSSIAAVYQITVTKFEPPCYVQWIRQKIEGDSGIATYCCYGSEVSKVNRTHYGNACTLRTLPKNEFRFSD